MKNILFLSIVILLTTVSCNTKPTVTETQLPSSNLRITYTRLYEDQIFSEFYEIDVTCITNIEICVGEPKLLFRSLNVPNNENDTPKGFITDYSWSPDGKKIALVSGRDILVSDIETQNWVNITHNSDIDEYDLEWSPDGKALYYVVCSRDYSGMCLPEFHKSDPKGEEKSTLLSSISKYINSFDISPNGTEIVYSITTNQGYDQIYKANLDGTKMTQITSGDINNNKPSFSPDGQKIAFVRYYYRVKADIIVRDIISGDEIILTENFENESFFPAFSPDGNWILFHAFDQDLNHNVYVVSLESGNIIQITENNESGSPAWRRIIN